MKKRWKKGLTGLLTVCMALSVVCPGGYGTLKAQARTEQSLEEYKDVLNYTAEYQDFREYQELHQGSVYPDDVYVLEGGDFVRFEGREEPEVLTDYEGRAGTSVLTHDTGMVEYEVDIRTEGMYQLSLTYYPVEGNGSSIQRAFFLDGELPYKQLSEIEFSRVWANSVSEWASDNQGNDLKPTQVEAPEWVESQLYDAEGYVVEPLSLYLTPGKHTITVDSQRETMVLGAKT